MSLQIAAIPQLTLSLFLSCQCAAYCCPLVTLRLPEQDAISCLLVHKHTNTHTHTRYSLRAETPVYFSFCSTTTESVCTDTKARLHPHVGGFINVLEMKLNINLNAQTLEDLEASRKNSCIEFGEEILSEIESSIAESQVYGQPQHLEDIQRFRHKILSKVESQTSQYFNNPARCVFLLMVTHIQLFPAELRLPDAERFCRMPYSRHLVSELK